MEKIIDCSIIIVNFNGKHFLESCLDSIMAENGQFSTEVYFVDNNSTDGSCDLVRAMFPWVKMICNNKNLGFAAANNQAIDICCGKYIFLLNPDTIIKAGSIKVLIETMENNPDAGAAAPKLYNSDGSLQFSIGKFPNWSNQIMECLFLHKIFRSYNRAGELVFDLKSYDQASEIDWAFGAALMVRKELIKSIGNLDEGYFFGEEEKDLCYRIKQARWKVLFVPTAKIIHYGRGWRRDVSIDKALIQGRIRFAKKHYDKFKSLILRLILLTNLNIRLLTWFMTFFVSSDKRLLARRKLKQYWAALAACLNI